jgi:hypothetical protein
MSRRPHKHGNDAPPGLEFVTADFDDPARRPLLRACRRFAHQHRRRQGHRGSRSVVLTEHGHEGKTYNITGSEALTHTEIASQLSEALGRHVTFVNIPESAMREALLGFGFPEWQADGLIEDHAQYWEERPQPYRHAYARSLATARTRSRISHLTKSTSSYPKCSGRATGFQTAVGQVSR